MATEQKSKVLLISEPFGEHIVKQVDIPTPSSGQLLIKVHAAALNPGDWVYQAYGLFKEAYPLTLGLDGAGEVIDVASDVTDFNKGDRVAFQSAWEEVTVAPIDGTFRQHIVLPTYVVAKIPDSVSYEQGSTLPLSIATIAIPLYSQNHESSIRLTPPWEKEGRGKYAGKSFFVPGGASQVGLFALQFAKLSGFSPIIATASAHNFELVKSFGATYVINRKLPADKVIEQIKEIAGGPVDLVYDALAKDDTLAISTAVTRKGGFLVSVMQYPEDIAAKLAEEKDVNVVWARGGLAIKGNIRAIDGLLKRLPEYVEGGLIKPGLVEVLPGGLRGIQGGLERLKNNEVSGVKLVVRPQETE